ncbi:enoyl-CoA hydratase/isomerase family protein [Micromonospora craniellae]|uniref:enoyl-CoA hydratase/isomerase family protein n=1 Tax=Micromonospora craniellae TaxID=2294034 RepID=UPI001314208B|nr:enoyl-CoA hydratase-related protein [Micromonospora craniellae]QOC92128.1 enoyl-CoA hydratase/isomerase family protein [Micromonospora craniellae]
MSTAEHGAATGSPADPGRAPGGAGTRAVRVTRDGSVLTVTIDRPARRNAMTYAAWDELGAALNEAAAGDARVVVVTGTAGAFCSGGDLDGGDRAPHPHAQLAAVARTCQTLVSLPQPTIAQVDGLAVGAGFGLALACDFVVASSRARFGTMFLARGLSPDFATSWLLPRLVGPRLATRLCLLPEIVDADRAREWGLLEEVVAPDELPGHVAALATRLAAGPPIATRLTKQMLRDSWARGVEESLAAETMAQSINRLSADAQEGIAAFLERRPARFEGR